jgi:hypothetical protein
MKSSRPFALLVVLFGCKRDHLPERTIVIDSKPACADCTVRFTRTADVTRDYIARVFGAASLTMDSRDRYYVSHLGHHIAIFDSAGKHLKDVGREGRGPGEYRMVHQIIISPEDSLHVFGMPRGHDVMTPDYQIVRSHPFIPATSRLTQFFFSGGTWMVRADLKRDQPGFGQPLHTLTANDSIVRSFGKDSTYRSGYIAAFGGSRRGGVWIGEPSRYRLSLWDTTGTRLLTVIRRPDWFKGRVANVSDSMRAIGKFRDMDEEPIVASVLASFEDSAGRLWVFSLVPELNWKAGPPRPVDPRFGQRVPLINDCAAVHNFIDTMVEVLDLKTGRLITSTRLPFMMDGVLGKNRVFLRQGDSAGSCFFQVYQLTLEGI